MVSKESIRKAIAKQKVWRNEHPDASMGAKMLRGLQTSIEAHDPDLRLATLPSIITPMPEPVVDDLDRFIKKVRRKMRK